MTDREDTSESTRPVAKQEGSSASAQQESLVHVEAFQGPLPPPETLEKYNRICPGAAERIIQMAEQQSAHRRAQEKRLLRARIRDAFKQRAETRLGQWLGFAIGTTAIVAGSVVAVWTDTVSGGVAGSIIGGGGVVGLVSAFIYGRQRPPNEETTPTMDEPR